MAEPRHLTSSITLDQGGRITDCELLEELEDTPILQPKELLKFAIYFTNSPTNKDLANLLWNRGLASIVTNPRVAQVIMQTTALNLTAYETGFEEALELFDPWEDDNDSPQMSALSRDREIDDLSFLFIPICDTGLGLLIEKHRLKNGNFAFFVIGVGPDPETLSEPKASAPAPSN